MTMSFAKKLVYAFGQFALTLCAYAAGNLFLSYYVATSSPIFTGHIHRDAVLGLFTVAGLAIALGRLTDAGTSLLSGWLSDRSRFRRGRRNGFMLFAAAPLAGASFLVFTPPSDNLTANSLYVVIILLIFYTLLSFYATPYLALLPRIGKTRRERMILSVLMATATATASLLGNRIFTLSDMLGRAVELPKAEAFKIVLGVYALVSAIFLLLPPLLLTTEEDTDPPVRESFGKSFATVFRDDHFRSYLLADSMFRIASALVIAGFSWFVTILLGLDTRAANVLLLTVFFSDLVLFYPIHVLVKHLGKRKVLFVAYLLFITALISSIFSGIYPVSPWIQGMLLAFMLSIPYAVFTVIPNALVADLVVAAERKSGEQRGGMYFAIHTLIVKGGAILAGLLFSVFTLAVNGTIRPAPGRGSLRLVLVSASLFSIIGFFSLFGYHEKEVSAVLGDRD